MRCEEGSSEEVLTAGMTNMRYQREALRQIGAGDFTGDCTAGIVRLPIPLRRSVLRCVHVAAKRTLRGLHFAGVAIFMVGEKLLGHLHIDAALRLCHLLLPCDPARIL